MTAFFVVALILSVATGLARRIEISNLDSANFLSFMDRNTLLTPLQSDYAATNYGLIDLIQADNSKVCEFINHTNNYPRNFFLIHAYLIPTIMSLSAWILPVQTNWIAALWIAGSFVGGILALFLFLRRLKIPLTATFLFLSTLLLYPVLINSLLGQIYIDQLMFGPAAGLFLLIWWMKYKSLAVWRWALLLTIILGLVSERGAYLAGLASFLYLTLLFGFQVVRQRETVLLAIGGACCWIWTLVWTKFIQSNIQYQRLSISGALDRFRSLIDQPIRPMFIVFVMTSIVFLFLSAASGRGLIIAILAMAPNLLVSTGGAELTGFYTHYHQTYLPAIVATATIGFARIGRIGSTQINDRTSKTAPIASLVVLLLSVFIWTHYGTKTQFSELRNNSKDLVLPLLSDQQSYEQLISSELKGLTEYVATLQPRTISGPEFVMPALFLSGIQDVEYWPVGVGTADIVIAPWDDAGPNPWPFGDAWGNGPTLRACTLDSLGRNYNLIREFQIRSSPVRIYQKIGQ